MNFNRNLSAAIRKVFTSLIKCSTTTLGKGFFLIILFLLNRYTFISSFLMRGVERWFSYIPLFCHSPVFPMISNFQSHVIVNDLGWGDRIRANFALSRIATLKKWRDRLLFLHSRIQKMQVFSESDRRGVTLFHHSDEIIIE